MRDEIGRLKLGTKFRIGSATRKNAFDVSQPNSVRFKLSVVLFEELGNIKGTGLDWVSSLGIVYLYHIQLGTNETTSYVAMPSEIHNVSKELFVGFRALVEHVENGSGRLTGILRPTMLIFVVLGIVVMAKICC